MKKPIINRTFPWYFYREGETHKKGKEKIKTYPPTGRGSRRGSKNYHEGKKSTDPDSQKRKPQRNRGEFGGGLLNAA